MPVDCRTILVAALAALAVLTACVVLGPLIVSDSADYLAYASDLRAGTIGIGPTLLQTVAPVTLFRMAAIPPCWPRCGRCCQASGCWRRSCCGSRPRRQWQR